ncbi:MAG TPA: SOS response-associated peptidase [Steroidobacteraceae bacterium]|nr:SOS response-associated peptidase [Steroidobacteraceae bacterium]
MCGRYAFFSPAEAVKRAFALDDFPALEPRYNIAPTQPVPVLREEQPGRRQVALLHWGLIPSWARDRSVGNRMINARAETLSERPAFRAAFRRRRCVVLADGWYEWQVAASGKQPWFIHSRDGAPLGLAGLWETWRDPAGGEPVESCTIVTTDAVGPLAEIHHRMPAVLPAAGLEAWLDPRQQDVAALSGWLGPRDPAEFSARAVSRRVNDPRNQGADLIEAVE